MLNIRLKSCKQIFLLFAFILFFKFSVDSQTFERPVLEVVSVDTFDQKPTLQWYVQYPDSFDQYAIKRYLFDVPGYQNNFHTIDTIEDTYLSFYKDTANYITEALPDQRSEKY